MNNFLMNNALDRFIRLDYIIHYFIDDKVHKILFTILTIEGIINSSLSYY